MSQALLGLVVLVGLAWLTSSNRRAFPWRTVASGLSIQLLLALAFLKLPPLQGFLLLINEGVLAIEAASATGTELVFGFLGGGPSERITCIAAIAICRRASPRGPVIGLERRNF